MNAMKSKNNLNGNQQRMERMRWMAELMVQMSMVLMVMVMGLMDSVLRAQLICLESARMEWMMIHSFLSERRALFFSSF